MEFYGVTFHMVQFVVQYFTERNWKMFTFDFGHFWDWKGYECTHPELGEQKERHCQSEDGIHTTEKLTRIWIRQKECFHLT